MRGQRRGRAGGRQGQRSGGGGGFHKAKRHVYRMELELEFDEPVAAASAKEIARRMVEGLTLAAQPPGGAEGLAEARLTCHDLRASLAVVRRGGDGRAEEAPDAV